VRTGACAVLCLPSRVITRENAASFPLFSLLLALALSGALSLSFSSSCSCSYSPFRVLLRFIYSYIIENILTSYRSLFTYFYIFSSLFMCLLVDFSKDACAHTTHHILAGAIAEPEGSSRSTGIYPGDSHRVRDGSARWERLMSLLHPWHGSWGILVGIFETSGLHSGPAPSVCSSYIHHAKVVGGCLQNLSHFARVHFTRSGRHRR